MTSLPHACNRLMTSLILLACLLSSKLKAEDKQVFESRIRPFLKEYCVSCHGPVKA